MTIKRHSVQRAEERYNLGLSEGDLKNIRWKIFRGEYLKSPQEAQKNLEFVYIKHNHVPLKALINKKSGVVVTFYPFDVDEYNQLVEEKRKNKLQEAINLLKKHKYIVYKRRKNTND